MNLQNDIGLTSSKELGRDIDAATGNFADQGEQKQGYHSFLEKEEMLTSENSFSGVVTEHVQNQIPESEVQKITSFTQQNH